MHIDHYWGLKECMKLKKKKCNFQRGENFMQVSNCTWVIDFVQKLHRPCSYNTTNVSQETRWELCDGEERKLLKDNNDK